MTEYKIDDSEFASLRGKTVLLTGCATGIGRATAYLAHSELPASGNVIVTAVALGEMLFCFQT